MGKKKETNSRIIIALLFYILIIAIALVFFFQTETQKKTLTNRFIQKILRLNKKNQSLDKQITNKITFKLADRQRRFEKQDLRYILEGSDGNLWIFNQQGKQTAETENAVYRWARICGICLPEVYSVGLPINGEVLYGSIMKFIPETIRLDEVKINELSPKQIRYLQKQQVLDWLIFSFSNREEQFVVKKESGDIISIDKNEAFSEYFMELSLSEKIVYDSYYGLFWQAYIDKKIEVDFSRTFELIDHIQNINDETIKKVFGSVLNADAGSLVFRKKNLRSDFEKFYKQLAEKRGEVFLILPEDKTSSFSKRVLKETKKYISGKELLLSQLISKGHRQQENILAISSEKAWWLIRDVNAMTTMEQIRRYIKELTSLRKSTKNIREKLAISLYIKQISHISLYSYTSEINEIFQPAERHWDAIPVIKSPKGLDITRLEYNLRVAYNTKKTTDDIFAYYKKAIKLEPDNLILLLNYLSFIGKEHQEDQAYEEYCMELNNNPDNPIYEICHLTYWRRYNYIDNWTLIEKLKNIDDNPWKHIILAITYYEVGREVSMVSAIKKAVILSKNKSISYTAYILLGSYYEYNHNGFRFGNGFDVDRAIDAYKGAVKSNPDSAKAHLNLGVLYMSKGLPDEALAEFKEVAKIDTAYAKEHFHFEFLKDKSAYKDKHEYMEALRMNSLSGEDHYIIGLAHLTKKQLKAAKRHFEKARQFGYGDI